MDFLWSPYSSVISACSDQSYMVEDKFLFLRRSLIPHKCVECLPHAWHCSRFREYHSDQNRQEILNMCQVVIRGTETHKAELKAWKRQWVCAIWCRSSEKASLRGMGTCAETWKEGRWQRRKSHRPRKGGRGGGNISRSIRKQLIFYWALVCTCWPHLQNPSLSLCKALTHNCGSWQRLCRAHPNVWPQVTGPEEGIPFKLGQSESKT